MNQASQDETNGKNSECPLDRAHQAVWNFRMLFRKYVALLLCVALIFSDGTAFCRAL
jgi:hypothetical protein